jgi:flavodoxin
MYRGVIIYAPAEDSMEGLVRRLAACFNSEKFEVEATPADRAAVPDLTKADVFLLASLPAGQQPIHPDFTEILRALRGITLAGRVGGAFSVDSEPTVSAFRRALQDCELVIPDQNFRNLSGEHPDSAELSSWVEALTRQLEDPARER